MHYFIMFYIKNQENEVVVSDETRTEAMDSFLEFQIGLLEACLENDEPLETTTFIIYENDEKIEELEFHKNLEELGNQIKEALNKDEDEELFDLNNEKWVNISDYLLPSEAKRQLKQRIKNKDF